MEQRINYLLQQFEAEQLSTVERQELQDFAEHEPELITDEIAKMIVRAEGGAPNAIPDQKWNSVLNRILAVDKAPIKRHQRLFHLIKWVVAAVVFIAFSFTTYIFLHKRKEHVFASDIKPGSNKAILTLADGRKISLSDATNGAIAKQAGLSISKTADGQLVYNIDESENVDDTKLNTISTPNGGEWQIRLPDGSIVWLNAASSLTYSLNIASAKQRLVKLQGEAYFEVTKDKAHPFIVSTDRQSVEVLGTHFNINNYSDELVVRTTLLEGSIRVSSDNTQEAEILKPGEQSLVSANGITIDEVNVDESVAWKKGYFMFDNEQQESIMRKIARWYNVEIEYADQEAKNVVYYGTVSRFEKISKVLRKFEQTGEVRFDIKGNKIIVYKE